MSSPARPGPSRYARLAGIAVVTVLALMGSMLVSVPASAEVLSAPVVSGGIDPNSPRLQWSPVVGAAKYRVEMSGNPDYTSPYYAVTTFNLEATPFKDAPIGTNYYRVRAIDPTSVNGAWAEGTFVRVIQDVADGIDSSTTVSPADGSAVNYPAAVVLRWPWTARVYSYSVQVDDDPGFPTPTSYTNVQGTSLALTTSFPFGAPQYWRVKGVSDTGAETNWSGPWSFTPAWPLAAAVPTGLQPTDDPTGVHPMNDVRLSWNPVTGAEKYEVQVSLSSDFSDPTQSIFNDTVTSTSWTPQPALAAASYFWRVRAVAVGDRKLTSGWTGTRQFRRSWGFEEGNPTAAMDPNDASLEAYPVPKVTSSSGTVARDDFRLEWEPVRRAGAYVVQVSTSKTFPSSPVTPAQTITCTTYRTSVTANRAGSNTELKPFPLTTVPSNTNTLAGSISCDSIDPATPSTSAGLKNGVPYFWRVMAVDTSSTSRRANDPNIVMTPWSSDQQDPLNPPSFQLDATLHTGATTGPDVTLLAPADGIEVPDAPELTWKPVTGYALYRVQTSLNSAFTNIQSIQYTTSTRLIPAGSMKDNDTSGSYYWRVQACAAPGDCQPTTGVRQFKKRNKTVDLHPVVMTDGQVDFSWDTLSQTAGSAGVVRGYRIEISTNPDFTVTAAVVDSDTVDVPYYTAPATHFGIGQYYWRVVPIDDNLRELPSTATDLTDPDQTWRFTVTTSPNSVTEPATGTSVAAAPTFRWSPSTFVTGYQVEVYQGGTLSGPTYVTSGTVASAAWTPYSKKFAAGLYSWRVRKIGPGGAVGSWNTDTLPVPTFQIGSAAPSGLAPSDAAVLDPGQQRLRWDPVRGAVSYKLLLTGTGVTETTVTAYTQQAPVSDLVAGTDYTWTVAAVNAFGDSLGESAPRSFRVRTVPDVPGSPSASASGTAVNVGWSAPVNDGGTSVTQYRVRYRVFGSSDSWTVVDRTPDARSVALLGLATSTKYEAQVAALNTLGQSVWTSIVSATTATTPAAPTGLKTTAGADSLTVSWSKPSDGGSPITGYVLRYTPAGGATTTVPTTTTSTKLTGLAAGTAYSVEVAAVNAVGTGSFATAVLGTPTSGTTPTPTPTPTTTTKPPASTATSVTIAGGRTVVSGAGAALSGVLKTSAGAAVSGKSVTVQSRPVGATSWTAAATVTTTSTGGWTATVKPTENREFRAVFAAATPYTASSSGTTTVLVAPKITRKLSATTVKKGAKVTFTGTVSPAHKGKTVALQRLQSGTWVTKKSATTSTTSTYKLVWKTDSTKDFRWRVYMAKDAQHVAGASPKILLTVK